MRYTSALTTALYAGLGTYLVALTLLGATLDGATVDRLFSEAGPFERLSIVLWLVLGALALAGARPSPPRRLAMACAAALFSAREAGWHKAFTSDSLLKTNYYESAAVPLSEKLIAAPIALAVLALFAWLIVAGTRALLRRGSAGHWPFNLAMGFALLVVTKVVDRAPSILAERFSVELPATTEAVVQALEEGGEMALPVVFFVALLQYRSSAGIAHPRSDTVDTHY